MFDRGERRISGEALGWDMGMVGSWVQVYVPGCELQTRICGKPRGAT